MRTARIAGRKNDNFRIGGSPQFSKISKLNYRLIQYVGRYWDALLSRDVLVSMQKKLRIDTGSDALKPLVDLGWLQRALKIFKKQGAVGIPGRQSVLVKSDPRSG